MAFHVKEVYSGSCVLLTGATGFLGKVIVEKLLWTIDDIAKIYLLIRPRKGKCADERLADLLHDPLFTRLHAQKPEVFEKLIAVQGDVMVENLGLSPDDIEKIRKEVSVVFHSAATVKFDAHLREAVTMNVIGTQRIIHLCHQIKHLKALVHVSTAYANCDRFEIAEKIYRPPMRPQRLIDAMSWLDDETLTKITPQLLGLRPNTYTLTKALAESIIESESLGIPIVIVRPSIVGAMWRGPLPGWIDNLNGPTGLWIAAGRGVVTNILGSNEATVDIIPVDCVANIIIVAAAHRASRNSMETPVIHCSSGELNPLIYERAVVFVEQFFLKYPLEQCFGVPSLKFHKSRLVFLINFYLKHHIPAAIADILTRFFGKSGKNLEMSKKVWRLMQTLQFFLTRGWQFNSRGMLDLYEQMTPEDREEFSFDVRQLDWDEYLFDYLTGIRKYILKEEPASLERSRANLFKLRVRRQLLAALVYSGVVATFGGSWETTTKCLVCVGAMLVTFLFVEMNLSRRFHFRQ